MLCGIFFDSHTHTHRSSNIWQNNWLIEKSHLPHYKHVRIDSKAIFFFSNGVVLMAAFAIEVRGKIFTFLTFSKQWRNIFKSPSGQIRYKRMTNNMVWKKIIQSGLYLRHREYSYCRPISEITPIPKVVLPFQKSRIHVFPTQESQILTFALQSPDSQPKNLHLGPILRVAPILKVQFPTQGCIYSQPKRSQPPSI